MSALDDLKAAGIQCREAVDYVRCAENIETFPCDECSLHDPNGSPRCYDRLVPALVRIAIRLSGELAAAKAHWDAAASIAREREAERDRLRSCLEETESAKTEMREERDRARALAVGLEQECARLRGMLGETAR